MRRYEGEGGKGARLAPGSLVCVTGAALTEIGNPSRKELVFILLGFMVMHDDKWDTRGHSGSGV